MSAVRLALGMFILSCSLFAQTELWVYTLDGPLGNDDEALDVALDAEGNVYAAGYTYGMNRDMTLVSLTPDGAERWQYVYNGPASYRDEAKDLLLVDSVLYASGYSYGMGTSADLTVASLDLEGNERWVYRFNGTQDYDDIAFGLCSDPQGNIYVAGMSWNTGHGEDVVVIALDPGGVEKWCNVFGAGGTDYAFDIAYGEGGYLYVCGRMGDPYNDQLAVVKLDTAGNILWTYMYDGPGHGLDYAWAIVVGPDGKIYAAGESYGGSDTRDDIVVVSLDSEGNERWVYRYHGPGGIFEEAVDVVYGPDGNIYVTGYSDTGYDRDLVLISLSTNGEERWVYRYASPGSGGDCGFEIAYSAEADIFVAGFSSPASQDMLALGVDSSGVEEWAFEYNGSGGGQDGAYSLVYRADGVLYLAGYTTGETSGSDFTVVALSMPTAEAERTKAPGFVHMVFPSLVAGPWRGWAEVGEPMTLGVLVYDPAGRLRWEEKVSLDRGRNEVTLSVMGRLPAGRYFARFVPSRGRCETRSVVVVR